MTAAEPGARGRRTLFLGGGAWAPPLPGGRLPRLAGGVFPLPPPVFWGGFPLLGAPVAAAGGGTTLFPLRATWAQVPPSLDDEGGAPPPAGVALTCDPGRAGAAGRTGTGPRFLTGATADCGPAVPGGVFSPPDFFFFFFLFFLPVSGGEELEAGGGGVRGDSSPIFLLHHPSRKASNFLRERGPSSLSSSLSTAG